MGFTVTTRPVDDPNGHVHNHYHGEARYSLLDNACLKVTDEDGAVVTFAPGVWLTITEQNGGEKPRVTVF